MNTRILITVAVGLSILIGALLGSVTFEPGFAALWWMATMAAAAGVFFVTTAIRFRAKTTAWAWIILTVLVLGGVYKSFNFWTNYGSGRLYERYRELAVIPKSIILAGNRWVFACLTVFLVVAAVILLFGKFRHGTPYPLAPVTNRRTGTLLIIVLGGTAVASLLQISLGLAVLGTEAGGTALPFRLGTVINRFTIDVAPMLLLLCYWIFEQQNHRIGRLAALCGLMFQGVVFSVISTSRGGLAQYLLPLLILWILIGRFTGARRTLALVGTVFFLLMLPFLTQLRIQRLHASEGWTNDVVRSVQLTAARPAGDLLTESVEHITNRFVGAEGVWYTLLIGRDKLSLDERISIVTTPYELGSYYTLVYTGVTTPGDFRSPGLMGAMMIMGGTPIVIMLLIGFYTLAIAVVWGLACRLPCWPVVLAGLGKVVLVFTNEGTLLFQNFVSFALVALLVQMMYAWLSDQRVVIGRSTFAVEPTDEDAESAIAPAAKPAALPAPEFIPSPRTAPVRGLAARRLAARMD